MTIPSHANALTLSRKIQSEATARPFLTILLCLLFAIMYLDRANISASASSIQTQFSLSNQQLGLIFSAFSWAYLASVIIGGWSAARYGSRFTLAFFVMIVGLGTIAAGFAFDLTSLFITRLIVGFGEGPVFPIATQAMRSWYPARQYGYIQGITHSASRFGSAITPIVIATLIMLYSWQMSFFISGGLALLWAIAWVVYFKDDPRRHKRIASSELAQLDIVLPDRHAKTPLKALSRRMFPVTLVMIAYGWSYWMFLTWLPLYFANRHGTDLKTSSLATTLTLSAGIIGNLVGGILSDFILSKTRHRRLARCGVVCLSLLGAGGFLIACSQIDTLLLAIALLAGAVFFLELTIAPIYAVSMDISREFSGLGSAFIIMGVAIAGIISPVVFGKIIDATHNWDLPLLLGVVILFAGSIIIWTVNPNDLSKNR